MARGCWDLSLELYALTHLCFLSLGGFLYHIVLLPKVISLLFVLFIWVIVKFGIILLEFIYLRSSDGLIPRQVVFIVL